ncbi:SDR family NAD(P)-dependent oxidoreductase [Sphingobium phenoxybenzoativorans]|uniref:SDR family NAD(P)-dependent oxidoreductase n=1 Tax=Sphingobium phenoxybenzoativorans TaxID=1592790 RepID=UPI000AB4D04F|nr:SDR family NAD(P)-dependent oxidoreductase [Sphingobium phenoxybenzoativorans]
MTGQRVALVTGAAQGIGYGVAQRLGALGHHVALFDRDTALLTQAEQTLRGEGLDVSALEGDVASDASVKEAIALVEKRFGRLDILINNAGISPSHGGYSQLVEDVPLEEWDRVLAVNLTGTFYMCRYALPLMKAGKWGRIVNFSSQGGRMRSLLSGAHYAATKAGLIGFTRVLAGQVGGHGITANCIAPGRIDTEQSRSFGDTDTYLKQLPVGRFGEAADIAAGVEYLVSDGAGFVTGTVLDINGGFYMT